MEGPEQCVDLFKNGNKERRLSVAAIANFKGFSCIILVFPLFILNKEILVVDDKSMLNRVMGFVVVCFVICKPTKSLASCLFCPALCFHSPSPACIRKKGLVSPVV